MPLEALLGMYSSVGLGEMSGLNLVGETSGIFPNRHVVGQSLKLRPCSVMAFVCYAMQLAHAYATLANKGM